jgi:protein ImuA
MVQGANDNTPSRDDQRLKKLRLLVCSQQKQDGCINAEPPVLFDEASVLSGMVHEVWAEQPTDLTSAAAFILNAIKGSKKPFLWATTHRLCCDYGELYGPGLYAAGIDPARLLLVRCNREVDTLWALEEGLKTNALAGVIGEVGAIGLTASRRLNLVAKANGTCCFLLVRSALQPSTASYSRYQATSYPSESPFGLGVPGVARSLISLVKHRGGARPISQILEWPHAQDYLPIFTSMVDQSISEAVSETRYASG